MDRKLAELSERIVEDSMHRVLGEVREDLTPDCLSRLFTCTRRLIGIHAEEVLWYRSVSKTRKTARISGDEAWQIVVPDPAPLGSYRLQRVCAAHLVLVYLQELGRCIGPALCARYFWNYFHEKPPMVARYKVHNPQLLVCSIRRDRTLHGKVTSQTDVREFR